MKDTGNNTPKFLQSVVNTEAGIVTFSLGNGKSLSVDSNRLSDSIQHHAMLHGLKQKIADGAANKSKTEDYSGAFAELADIIENLYAGSWNRRATGTGGQTMLDLITVIAKLKKVTFEQAEPSVRAATDEARKEWMTNATVKMMMADLSTTRLKAAAKLDTSDILASIVIPD